MDTAKVYRSASGHRFTSAPVHPVEAFTTDDMEYISPGQTVTDDQGNRFEILEIRHVAGRLWRIVMLPEPAAD